MSKRKKYAPRTPFTVLGGIRAQHARSSPQRAWWARRWVSALEEFRIGARLGRGRSYAAAGQVSELAIQPGLVTAYVQGAGSTPYSSTIKFKELSGTTKESVVAALRQESILLAALLVGEMPVTVETIFAEAGGNLFPVRGGDVCTRCNCPDYANPCKHLAAVYYLLGEAITHNPLLLLELRGITRDDLFAGGQVDAMLELAPPVALAVEESPVVGESLVGRAVDDVEHFYGRAQKPFDDFGKAAPNTANAPLIYRLGALPFWRGHEKFVDSLEHLYTRAKARGLAIWAGETLDLRREDERTIITGANLTIKSHRLRIDNTLAP